ncbi:DUF697 domain-containing protein [filamentous cyanobacterium LEGE 11480]|uniref:DUF697 domain-containing protein n=1 Tax=Romeriopsis navalis LEGE 11480 TaxID=2777977 RepID=A0A928VPW6_9CYAN|nr:DUF697 domain-containing protein [Romeriopsis navalis]MBE9030731.1 DUF697 domain-containing protein [Romeriopsis navalis LEGE 11480]
MSINFRPWVIGGLGLAGSIWILDGITDFLGDWIPAIVIGSGITWSYLKFKGMPQVVQPISTRPITVETVKDAVAEAEGIVNQLATEVTDLSRDGSAQHLSNLRLQIHSLLSGLDRDEIRLAVMGGKGVGKSSLTELLEQDWIADISQQLHLADTPALFSAWGDAQKLEDHAWQQGKAADLVMFLTDGDLTESQMQVLQQLTAAHRRTLLVFNKQDQYLPREQTEILAKLQDRVSEIIRPEDVVTIATQPRPIKVRQHQADGSVKEWLEEPGKQITSLTDRLTEILLKEGQKLVLASSLGNAEALKSEARVQLNAIRRDRAMPLIERTQWLVAGTAFANPFPALDLLATAAINGQMVMELSQLYQKPLSTEQAQVIAKALASLMLKLGVVEAGTQAIAAVLKTNAITYAAGGLAQGVSGAYFSRLAGLTLIEYFETAHNPQWVKQDKLQSILKSVFQRNQRTTVLQLFVKQAVDRLIAETPVIAARTGTASSSTAATVEVTVAPQSTVNPPQPLTAEPKRQPLRLDTPETPNANEERELEPVYEERC